MTPSPPTPTDDLPPPVLVEDEEALGRLLTVLDSVDELAVDTEADSFYHYTEQVCLIQVSAADEDYLVDPLRGLDLSGLGRVFADASKTKVFHDGEYDVLIMKREYDFRFSRLFDTRIAAAALGFEAPGLAAVLSSRFGVELDKSEQRSNWSRRPLTPSQIAYARQDTRYLIALMRQLRAELEERGRAAIHDGECRRLEGLEPQVREFNPDEYVRLKGARSLSLAQLAVLRELYLLRDEQARARDVPPFKVLNNNHLVAIARARPRSMRALSQVEGLSPRIVGRVGEKLLSAVQRGLENGPLARVPRLPARDGTGGLDELGHELHDRLKTWRKTRAEADGLDASLVLNRLVLTRIAQERPSELDGLSRVEGVLPWHVERFGEELLGVVRAFEEDRRAGRIEPGGRRGRRRAPRRQ